MILTLVVLAILLLIPVTREILLGIVFFTILYNLIFG